MKKKLFLKFFVFAVIGSLLTFTSCKDYDDDIKNLQGQISSLKELSTKIDGLTADVATAKADAAKAKADAEKAIKDANALLDKVNEAGSKATEAEKAAAEAKLEAAEAKKAAAEAKEEALKALETELEKAKEELKAATDAELEKMNKIVAELAEKVEAQLGTIGVAITEVYFIEHDQFEGGKIEVDFSTVFENANVFGKGLEGEMTFTKDAQVQVGGHFFVKVSPANAVVTPEMIALQNGLGEILEGVTVTKVEAHTNLYTRATAPTGMWKVSVELDNYDAKAFEAATKKGNGSDEKILFAVSINNTQAEFEDRQVISDYELSLDWEEYNAEKDLFFTVNNKDVEEIRNRFGRGLNGVVENKWKTDAATVATKDNVAPDAGDDRQLSDAYPAVQGKDIVIELSEDAKALYVVLDKDYAYESAPSEINAWESYSYTGLNTVVEGTKATITIDSKTAIKDEIGFRVFAVNHDGTLVDPDGKAFYVVLDSDAAAWSQVNTVIIPQSATDLSTQSSKVNVNLTKVAGATAEWTTDKIKDNQPVFHANFYEADGTYVGYTGDLTALAKIDFSKVATVTTVGGYAWTTYEDDKAYNGKLTIKNGTGHVVATLDVTMTKKLPTEAPKGFSVKDKQIVNGVYNAYLEPNVWEAGKATSGSKRMDQIFNFPTVDGAGFITTFAESAKSGDKLVSVVATGAGEVVVGVDFIDNKTKHASVITYDYGQISSETTKVEGVDIPVKHVVSVYEFETIYHNIYNEEAYKWSWTTKNNFKAELVYKEDKVIALDKVEGKLAFPVGYDTTFADAKGLAIRGMELISKGTNNVDYFTVELAGGLRFTAVPKASVPTADVPSILVVTIEDMYGNIFDVELDMVVLQKAK